MASTTFVDNQTVIFAAWLNDVNSVTYNGIFQASIINPQNIVCNGTVSGTGFTGLVANALSSPPAIGSAVPNAGTFTTLSSATFTTSGLATLNSLHLTSALGATYGGTGLTATGTSGNVLTSDGTNWTSAAAPYLGVNQTVQNVLGSRSAGTTYTNSTGKPIFVTIANSGSSSSGQIFVNSVQVAGWSNNGTSTFNTYSFIVPNGSTYRCALDVGGIAIWTELR